MQKFKRYVKCALPYIFCAFFPLLFAAGIRTYYSFSIQENLMDTVRRESAFATEKVESQLKLIQNYSFDLCQLTERSSLCKEGSFYQNPSRVMKVAEYQNELKKYRRLFSNEDIYRSYCYFEKSGAVVSSEYSFLSREDFYDKCFKYGRFTQRQWFQRLMAGTDAFYPAEEVLEFGKSQGRYILHVQRCRGDKGAVFILFSPVVVTPYVEDIASYGGGIQISDNDGQILYTYPECFSEEKCLRESLVSGTVGWTFTYIVPEAYLRDTMAEYDIYLWATFIACLALSAGIVLLFAYKQFRVYRIINRAFPQAEGIEFNGNLVEAEHTSRRLQTLWEKRSAGPGFISEKNIMLGLLYQNVSRETLETLMKIFDADDSKLVLWIELRPQEAQKAIPSVLAYKEKFRTLLETLYPKSFYSEIDVFQAVATVSKNLSPEGLEGELREFIVSFAGQIDPAIAIFHVGLSDVFTELEEIRDHFENARNCMGYFSFIPKENLLLYREIFLSPSGRGKLFFPSDLELGLLHNIRIGNYDSVFQDLEKLRVENTSRGLSLFSKKMLLQELHLILVKMIDAVRSADLDYINRLSARMENISYEGFENALQQYIFLLLGVCNVMRMERSGKVIGEGVRSALTYVQEHFADSDLSIASVAENTHLSVPYLSKMFKESVGETFSSYVEMLRLEKACELLKKGESIEHTAQRVGDNSANTFRNTFKRRFGILPNEYRHISGEK